MINVRKAAAFILVTTFLLGKLARVHHLPYNLDVGRCCPRARQKP